MNTQNPKVKSKLTKNKPTKPKSTRNNKIKRFGKPAKTQEEHGVIPITPEFEVKLNKSFDSLERYFKAGAYSAPVIILISLYHVIKSNGDIFAVTSLIGVIIISIGMIFTYRLFSRQNQKSIGAFIATMISGILVSVLLKWMKGAELLGWEFFGFFFVIFFLMEMIRLRKYNLLY